MDKLQENAHASVDVIVTESHLAARLTSESGESFPEVFSTPWLLAQLERAAAKVLWPILVEGQLSVGAKVELEHLAPTPLGQKITAHARFLEKKGPLFHFEVWAEDGAGVIGKGTHARAIAPKAAVEKRAASRFAEA
ncbi:Fluoroacetyl-CoA thioesterase [Variovorax sp. PBS-H4]|uniref:thioesterase family protein n=1 Tax=Variovorax sp. PBS-H4 TaxID=434008 RepID=UPI0013162845|nr:hotdog domain-containing protein [Variovorax sp. PBS-H4]VTU40239.1 Fluoroacetyl-CoA thioesterase [Variovorax sp. PBS-H4]